MRILIAVHGYPPTFTGGAELRAARTARGLAARNHDVAVLCIESLMAPKTELTRAPELQDGVQVYQLYIERGSNLGEGYQQTGSPVIQDALQHVIREWHPDLIHLFSGYLIGPRVIDTATTYDVPVAVSLTDYWWLCHRINLLRTNNARCEGPVPLDCARCRSEIYRRFRLPSNSRARPLVDALWYVAERVPLLATSLGVDEQADRLQTMIAALNKAHGFIAPSRFLADMYTYYGVHQERMHVWRQGVNVDICPIRKPSPVVRFGYFGQIKHHKGVHTLLDAWERLQGDRQRSLTIYGSAHGEEEYGAQLQERARLLNDITWGRSIAHKDVWKALSEIDVLVIPSRWYENSPNVILEAQAMGVALIGTDLGGVAELVEHGHNGLRFTVDDADSLRAQIQRLLDEPELLGQLRKHQIPFHSFSDELDQIEGLYNQLIIQAITSETHDPIMHTNGTYSTSSQHATTIEME